MKVTVKDDSRLFDQFIKESNLLNEGGSRVVCGIHQESTNSEVFAYSANQEFNDGRPFIRQTFDRNEKELEERGKEYIKLYLEQKITKKQLYSIWGDDYVQMVKQSINNKEYKANAPSTIKQKGHDTPLQGKTGRLMRAIRFKVEGA